MRKHQKIEPSPKLLLVLFTIICILLLIISVFFKGIGRPFSNLVAGVVVPMQNGINYVGMAVEDHFDSFKSIKELQEENKALTKKVAELTQQNESLAFDETELNDLRKLVKLDKQYSDYHKVGARVISSGGSNWYENFIINKGTDDGIAVNMNVLAGSGLVGIVTEVGKNYAKVQTIIDDDSRVSAMSLETSDTCVVKGNTEQIYQDGSIDVTYISKDAEIMSGNELVTSHISSKYLEGLRIGTISEITMDSSNLTKSAKVTPVVDFQHIENVLVITDLKEVPKNTETAD